MPTRSPPAPEAQTGKKICITPCPATHARNDVVTVRSGSSDHPGLARAFASGNHTSLRCSRRRDDAPRPRHGRRLRQATCPVQAKRRGATPLGEHLIMWRLSPPVPTKSRTARRCRHIITPDTYERIAIKHLRDTCRQTIKSQAHADRMTGQIHLRTRHHRNHDRLRNTHRTRRSVRSLTNASTRRRVPHGRSISTIPGRSSIAGRASAPRSCGACPTSRADELSLRTVPSSLGSTIAPIERNPSAAPAGGASGCVCCADEDASEVSAVGRVPITFRQLNT